jgi:alpha-galactosidase
MTVYARNESGEDSRPFSLVVGDTLALTPPTGWNHWGGHASIISAEIIRAAADFFLEKGLADVGFRFIGIDDCWMRMSPETHESIFSDPELKAEYMRKHVGIDFEKTVGPTRDAQDPPVHPKTFWRPMAEYLEQTERDFVYNLCQYGGDDPWTWAPGIGVHTWRIGGDLNHYVSDYFDQAMRIARELRRYNGLGQWNDPDFIYVGRQVQTRDNHFVESSPTELDTNQEYQYVTLWAMVCAPFFFSTDVMNVSDFTINLLRNPEVMAVNQDELAHTAEVIRDADNRVVMCKKLADDALALAVFNRDDEDEATVEVSWADLGDRSEYEVTDLWRQTSLGTHGESIAVRLSANGVALLKLE